MFTLGFGFYGIDYENDRRGRIYFCYYFIINYGLLMYKIEKKINKGFLIFSNILIIVWNIFLAGVGFVLIQGGIVDHCLFNHLLQWVGFIMIVIASINMYK